jgi:hypothetical protein
MGKLEQKICIACQTANLMLINIYILGRVETSFVRWICFFGVPTRKCLES